MESDPLNRDTEEKRNKRFTQRKQWDWCTEKPSEEKGNTALAEK